MYNHRIIFVFRATIAIQMQSQDEMVKQEKLYIPYRVKVDLQSKNGIHTNVRRINASIKRLCSIDDLFRSINSRLNESRKNVDLKSRSQFDFDFNWSYVQRCLRSNAVIWVEFKIKLVANHSITIASYYNQ